MTVQSHGLLVSNMFQSTIINGVAMVTLLLKSIWPKFTDFRKKCHLFSQIVFKSEFSVQIRNQRSKIISSKVSILLRDFVLEYNQFNLVVLGPQIKEKQRGHIVPPPPPPFSLYFAKVAQPE